MSAPAPTPTVDDYLDPNQYPEEIQRPEEVLVAPDQMVADHDLPDINAERHQERFEATDAVGRALTVAVDKRGLDPVDAKVLRKHYGLFGAEQVPSLEEIGKGMGVSGSRVKARENRAAREVGALIRSSLR
jgi:DNA-directed RNA polymerase sigma subunit (sigma70/sigma32)